METRFPTVSKLSFSLAPLPPAIPLRPIPSRAIMGSDRASRRLGASRRGPAILED